jgi:hypothetical protein
MANDERRTMDSTNTLRLTEFVKEALSKSSSSSSSSSSHAATQASDGESTSVDTFVHVFLLGENFLVPGVYDIRQSKDAFLHAFDRAFDHVCGKTNKKVAVVHRRYKAYSFEDMTCENHDNKDVRVFREACRAYVTLGCDQLGEKGCVAVEMGRSRLPITAFPCTTSMAGVKYIKHSSIRVSPHVSINFETRLTDAVTDAMVPVISKEGDEEEEEEEARVVYVSVNVNGKNSRINANGDTNNDPLITADVISSMGQLEQRGTV